MSDPANCSLLLNDPPEIDGESLGYHEERCAADRPNNPTMLACRFQTCRLASFRHSRSIPPKEIAYCKPPACGRLSFPDQVAGHRALIEPWTVAGYARFVKVPANEEHGRELQLWSVSDGNGFQVLRFTDHFKAQYRRIFSGRGQVNKAADSKPGKRNLRPSYPICRLVTTMPGARPRTRIQFKGVALVGVPPAPFYEVSLPCRTEENALVDTIRQASGRWRISAYGSWTAQLLSLPSTTRISLAAMISQVR